MPYAALYLCDAKISPLWRNQELEVESRVDDVVVDYRVNVDGNVVFGHDLQNTLLSASVIALCAADGLTFWRGIAQS